MEADYQDKIEIKVDEAKVKRLLKKLIITERTNLKNKTYNDQQMVKLIKKFIEEEVECYSNQ